MDIDVDISINRIVSENNENCVYRILIKWNSNNFCILLLNDEQAYEGEVSEEYIHEQSSKLQVSPDAYINECRLILSENEGENKFTYIFDNNSFTWKKCLKDGIKASIGCVDLKLIPFSTAVNQFIDYTIQDRFVKNSVLRNSKDEIDVLRHNNEQLCQILTSIKELNVEQRKLLYSRFLSLLNNKKIKIQSLKDQLIS